MKLSIEVWKGIASEIYSELLKIRFMRQRESDSQGQHGNIFNEALTNVLARLYMRREDLPPGVLSLIWRYWPGNAQYYEKIRKDPLRFMNRRK